VWRVNNDPAMKTAVPVRQKFARQSKGERPAPGATPKFYEQTQVND